jgi:hypothetical protein
LEGEDEDDEEPLDEEPLDEEPLDEEPLDEEPLDESEEEGDEVNVVFPLLSVIVNVPSELNVAV